MRQQGEVTVQRNLSVFVTNLNINLCAETSLLLHDGEMTALSERVQGTFRVQMCVKWRERAEGKEAE